MKQSIMKNYQYIDRNMVALVFLFVSICSSLIVEKSQAAAAPSSPLVPKKPPFNGSIYGKRSTWPALKNIQEIYGYSNPEMYTYLQEAVTTESPAQIMRQQQLEAATDIIRAAVSLCTPDQQSAPKLGNLCAELLSYKQIGSKRGGQMDDTAWLGRLVVEN